MDGSLWGLLFSGQACLNGGILRCHYSAKLVCASTRQSQWWNGVMLYLVQVPGTVMGWQRLYRYTYKHQSQHDLYHRSRLVAGPRIRPLLLLPRLLSLKNRVILVLFWFSDSNSMELTVEPLSWTCWLCFRTLSLWSVQNPNSLWTPSPLGSVAHCPLSVLSASWWRMRMEKDWCADFDAAIDLIWRLFSLCPWLNNVESSTVLN